LPIPKLPPVREIVTRYGLDPRRSLGQHFIFDATVTERIAEAAGNLKDAIVYEVGPGPGGLTQALLETELHKLVAVENDSRCAAALEELGRSYSGRLRVVLANAVDVDETRYMPLGSHIVANLPYNIATLLLLKWLRSANRYASMTLMFQKEVAERLVAAPSTKDYGRLSVMTQWACETRILFDIPPEVFIPPPKVTSTLVSLVPRAEPLAPARRDRLEKVVASGFGQRRKMLRTALKTLGVDTGELLKMSDIDPEKRAEELNVEQFCTLARSFHSLSGRRDHTAAGAAMGG
jgi:16S rRNA (adenine1518-N6/adenine1519-N6)-dimethyltransferase